ncbi:hypothetical protein BJY16_005032 [Actinoplanes octamycinicus]|uniref:Uncharacterized protein n=1 Tax=Actinoplanes octamycinicus TaxID=135948 RepID=A0A7W7M923_9ACTN|nr:hypothetical protein [Actinoplanes octamycinicus]MBB4741573.1 hypothetical protein [Actinoplanes octamycinicus]GIE57125.1 hypothetical protein Aoc01nite_25270 [Actinoplanes octamycinicus]
MLKTRTTYRSLESFRKAHPLVTVPGDGFFANKTEAELQQIVKQTLTSLKKKRVITGPKGQSVAVKAAEDLLKAAGPDDARTVYVRWDIHQAEAGVARGGGDITMNHFSVENPGGGNDWHLYVDKGEATIIAMSQDPAVILRIDNV